MNSLYGSTQSRARHFLTPLVGCFLSGRNPVLLPLLATLLLILSVSANAKTVTAASVAQPDVSVAITSAVDGDTVFIPAGTSQWNTYALINKAITIQGAGVGNTIIQIGSSNANVEIFAVIPPVGKVVRITGIEFQMGTQTAFSAGLISTDGGNGTGPSDGGSVRIDHCKFNGILGRSINPANTFGVIDHCTFLPAGTNSISIYVFNKAYGGGVIGNNSFFAPTNFGTNKFLFIEDCTFNNDHQNYACIDSYGGSRYVFRHNTCINQWLEAHGTESSQMRGTRAMEIYNNTFTTTLTPGFAFSDIRSGTAVLYNNTTTAYGNPVISVTDDRVLTYYTPFGAADGTNPWDVNDTIDHTGNGFGGGLNGLFASGTVSSAGTLTMTVTGAGWATNQWQNYSVIKTSGPILTAQPYAVIRFNTNNTITFGAGLGTNLTFAPGDRFAIRRVIQSIDQPGRVLGSLLIGNTPSIPRGWNDQVTEPIYSWNNTYEGGNILIGGASAGPMRAGEHYINNGSTPMPGYVAYTYPHPLITGGAVASPPAPANLRVLSGP